MRIIKFIEENKLVLILIIVGALLRLVYLGKLAPGLFRDEGALGYNAYSIWITGKDEFGLAFPFVFRSFEVFFLPAYVYLSAPIVGLIGLSAFSTRLLSSLSGVVALIFVYKITILLWDKKAAVFSLLVFVIAPWHIFYSRGAFEGNLALTFLIVGFYFWLKFLKSKKIWQFCLSTFLFALSMYSYQAERIVIPLFALGAIVIYFKSIWKLRMKILPWCIALFIFLLPLISLTFKAGGYHRASGVSIFSQEHPPGWIDGQDPGLLINNVFYLRAKQIATLYISYYSPYNLFVNGDANGQRGVENMTVFYFWMLPFLVLGLIKAIKSENKYINLVLLLLVLGPLPASLTADPFHTYRSLILFFPISLLIGLGMSMFRSKLINFSLILISLASLIFFTYNYFVLTPVTRAIYWDYGYREVVNTLNSLPKDKKVVVYDRNTESYIHYLFFDKFPPQRYQKLAMDTAPGFQYYYQDPSKIRPLGVENIEFRKIDWRKERGDSGTYFLFSSDSLPESEFVGDPRISLVKEIFYPNGVSAFRLVYVE